MDFRIMMCQGRFILSKNCITLVSGVDNEKGRSSVGQRVYEKFLYIPLDFTANLKLL